MGFSSSHVVSGFRVNLFLGSRIWSVGKDYVRLWSNDKISGPESCAFGVKIADLCFLFVGIRVQAHRV